MICGLGSATMVVHDHDIHSLTLAYPNLDPTSSVPPSPAAGAARRSPARAAAPATALPAADPGRGHEFYRQEYAH